MEGRKRKRIVLTIEEKLRVCDEVRKGKPLSTVAKEVGVGKSTVHDIVKSYEKLKSFQGEVQEAESLKKRRIVRRADLDKLDKAVYLWFVQQRCQGK